MSSANPKCVPGALVQRRRRRRFAERELLERIRHYEDLLRRHNIEFEPLHKDSTGDKETHEVESGHDSDDGDHHEPTEVTAPDASSTAPPPEKRRIPKSILQTMSQGFRDPGRESDSSDDDVRESTIRKAWDLASESDDHLMFGPQRSTLDLAAFHPDAVQIFRLWQIYLDNVNALLKVTHTPTLQPRIIEAASNLTSINPNLEALMFSIYSMAILSMTNEACQSAFSVSREDLLARYQFGCQQALSKCGVLRTNDRDCLTAFYLYLISVRQNTVALSLSTMLAGAIRIAQRMGIHNENLLARCTILEAEMRRRLWWSLVLFDVRICGMTNTKITNLDPTWDCKVPLNINDTDLRAEMKTPPIVSPGVVSESIFAVIRNEAADFVRHADYHLEFANPLLKAIVRQKSKTADIDTGSDTTKLEKTLEDHYLQYCDEGNPLQYMSVWTMRGYLAKYRLLQHHGKFATTPTGRQTDAQRDLATSYALKMLECDTKTMTSSLTQGFRWFNQMHFPFLEYLQVVQDLRRRPTVSHAKRSWEIMSDNFAAWSADTFDRSSPFFAMFAKIVLQAWHATETAIAKQQAEGNVQVELVMPGIVSSMRQEEIVQQFPTPSSDDQSDIFANMDIDSFAMPMPMGFGIGTGVGGVSGGGVVGGLPSPSSFDFGNMALHGGRPGLFPGMFPGGMMGRPAPPAPPNLPHPPPPHMMQNQFNWY